MKIKNIQMHNSVLEISEKDIYPVLHVTNEAAKLYTILLYVATTGKQLPDPNIIQEKYFPEQDLEAVRDFMLELVNTGLIEEPSDPEVMVGEEVESLAINSVSETAEKEKKEKSKKRKKKLSEHQRRTKGVYNHYIDRLYDLGKRGLLTEKFRKSTYIKVSSIVSDFKSLTIDEFKEILDENIHSDWVKKNKLQAEVKAVLNGTVLRQYLEEKRKKEINKVQELPILNHKGEEQSREKWGYFSKDKDGHIKHVPPKDANAPYHKIMEYQFELLSAVPTSMTIPEEYEECFGEFGIKDKYSWMVGNTGPDDRFVGE